MSMGMDPATATMLSMAMQGVGTLMQKQQQDDVRERQLQTLRQQGEAQAQYARQNAARVAQTTDAVKQQNNPAQAPELEAKVEQQLMPAAGVSEASYMAANPGAPKEVSDAYARAIGDAMAKGKGYAKSQSKLSAIGQANANTGTALSRGATDIGVTNNFAGGSGQVAQQNLNAIQPNQGMGVASDLLNGAGGIGALYASRMRPGAIPNYSAGIDASGMY